MPDQHAPADADPAVPPAAVDVGGNPFAVLRALVRDPLAAIPAACFRERLVRQSLFGRPRVFACDPALVEEVLLGRAAEFGRSEAMSRALRPALGDAILTADGERWRWQRRAAAPAFRHDRLRAFRPAMRAAAADARDRLLLRPPGAEAELVHEMTRVTFDVITATMLSGGGAAAAPDPGAAGAPPDHAGGAEAPLDHAGGCAEAPLDLARIERGITDYLESTGWSIALALLRAPAWTPYPGRARAARARDYLRDALLRLARERRASLAALRATEAARGATEAARGATGAAADGADAASRPDLLTLLLDAADPDTGRAMDDRDLADNLLTFITAGHETTALALCWTLRLLADHPEAEARLLREFAAAGAAPDPAALPFARQVVLESMRLFPPAPIIARMALRDLELGGLRLAAGTPVYVPVYAVHRHRALWDAPERFRPERFRPEVARGRHRCAFLPFGAGPRTCIGAGFATDEAVLVLATLLPALRFRATGPAPRPRMRITLRPAGGMPMRVEPRAAG